MTAGISAYWPFSAAVPLALRAGGRRTRDGVQCSPQHGLRVWGLIFVVLLASLTQAGVPLALHWAGGSGPGSLTAASDVIYICTGSGIQPVRLDASGNASRRGGVSSLASEGQNTPVNGKSAPSHAFCAHCAFCHALPVLTAEFLLSHPVAQTRIIRLVAGKGSRHVRAIYGFAARGPPVVPA